ncbi:hypothetical protein [Alkaliphilus hydrothermalis]|uniref:Uncharacterized protein n=1 Tax=Alkaliphilus hydrothermalis TaxID=1482730 RepID=A0ABS2NL74_9FIRM|nr:hypothetical protein [Alkaliphilus hydrothermalis]MBM7613687.1 hypothetical protein [Alkaliphilus hydrothermalis]
MSIKPIDFHVTYANTVNESKIKQTDFNRARDFQQIAHHQQQVEDHRNRQRINSSEESKGKTIQDQESNNHNQSAGGKKQHSPAKKNSIGESEENVAPRNSDFKGLKIDIMI